MNVVIALGQVLLVHHMEGYIGGPTTILSLQEFIQAGFWEDLNEDQRYPDPSQAYIATVNSGTAEVAFGPLTITPPASQATAENSTDPMIRNAANYIAEHGLPPVSSARASW